MKKLTAILKESGLQEELIPIREKEIGRLIEEYKDTYERNRITRQMAFKKMEKMLNCESEDVRKVFNNLLRLKASINEDDNYSKAVVELEKYLYSEVEDSKEKADNE